MSLDINNNPYASNGEPVGAKRPVEVEPKPVCRGVSEPLQDWQNGDFGSYIEDFWNHHKNLKMTAMKISEKAAEGIVQAYGKTLSNYGNKRFTCISKTGYIRDDGEYEQLWIDPYREGRTFLYKHDFKWWIYNIRYVDNS